MQPIKKISRYISELDIDVKQVKIKSLLLNNEKHHIDCASCTYNAVEITETIDNTTKNYAECCPATVFILAEHLLPSSLTPAVKALDTLELIEFNIKDALLNPPKPENYQSIQHYILDICNTVDEAKGSIASRLLKVEDRYRNKLEKRTTIVNSYISEYRSKCLSGDLADLLKQEILKDKYTLASTSNVLYAGNPVLRQEPRDDAKYIELQSLLLMFTPELVTTRAIVSTPQWVYEHLQVTGGAHWLSQKYRGLTETQMYTIKKLWSNDKNDLYYDFDTAVQAAINV